MDESLQCQQCPYSAPRSERLKKHIEVKHLGLRLACDLCDYTSTESSNLKKHRERIHESVKYPCEECDRIFLDKYYLKRHMNNIHSKLPRPVLFCDDCGKKFKNKNYLKKHNTLHLGLSYPCDNCEFKTNSKSNLRNHVKLHHEKKEWFQCNICEYKGSKKKGLRIHKESKHGTNNFKCNLCEYETRRNEYLKRHIKRQHGTDVFYCSKCEFSCKSKDSLRDHTKVHSNNMIFQCEKCDYSSCRKNMSRHMMVTHEMKRHKCDTCGKLFIERRELKMHKLNKHEGVFWDCNLCNFKAAHPNTLKEHKKYQHGVNINKKHKCSECGKLFNKKYTLTVHFRIHSGERPHQCQFCEQKFRGSVSHWHRHGFCKKKQVQKIKCAQCGFLSENQEILKLHTLSHQISLVDIMNNLPTSIKEESFKSEEEFLTDLKGFLENNPVQIFKQNLHNQTIEKHEYTSLDPGQMKCDSCDRVISSKNMKRHMREVHETDAECKKCGKKFKYKSSLPRHMRQAHSSGEQYYSTFEISDPEKRNKCEIDIKLEKSQSATLKVKCEESECNAVIKSKGLKKHKRLVHEKIVKSTIQCDRCDKWLSNAFSLSRHTRLVHHAINENSNRDENL